MLTYKGFTVGDRVILVSKELGDMAAYGNTGTVCTFIPAYSEIEPYLIGVEFDEKTGAHDCDGNAKAYHGLWLRAIHLKHLKRIMTIQDWIKNKRNNVSTGQ